MISGDQEQEKPDPEDAVETPTRPPPLIGRLASDSSANGSLALPGAGGPSNNTATAAAAAAAPLATLGEATAPDALVGTPVPGFGEAVVAAACCQGNFQALRNIAATLAKAPRGGSGGGAAAAAGATAAATEVPWHSRPLDTAGNTALHSVLLGSWCLVREAEQQQQQQQQQTQAAAAAAVAGSGGGAQAATGGLLACCFGGGAAPLPDGVAAGSGGSWQTASGGMESPVSPPSSTFSGRRWSSSGGGGLGGGFTGAGGGSVTAAAAAARPAHIDGHISSVAALLSFGADPSATNAARVTPAMLVALGALGGSPQTPHVLSALVPNPRLANASDATGRCALALAARHLPENSPAALACKVASLKALLSAGADVNRADSSGMTSLMHAADAGCDKAVLAFLLGAGANARLMDDHRKSALTYAFYAQHLTPSPAVTEEQRTARRRRGQRRASGLFPNPASPTYAGGNGSEAAAGGSSSNGHAMAAAAAAAVAAVGANSALPSHGAVLRVLLSYGALSLHPDSINTRFPDMAGRTQLHVAVRRGDARAVEVLLASGADVDAQDDEHGNTPLHYYGIPVEFDEESAAAIVEALLHHGADPNAKNAAGLQPLDLACRQDRPPSGGSRHGSSFTPPPVRPRCVTIHAHLVAHGATHSEAFRNSPALTRGKTLSRVLFSAQSFGSIRGARSNPRTGLAPSQASSSSVGTARAPSSSSGSARPAALARR